MVTVYSAAPYYRIMFMKAYISRRILIQLHRKNVQCELQRICSTSSPATPDYPVPAEYKNTLFKPIYRFPKIVLIRALSRLKIFQTGFTVSLIPAMWYAYVERFVELDSVVNGLGLSSFAMFMLYVMSGYFRRIIGLICVSEDEQILRVSHLTFWGKRYDLYINTNNIVPLSDTPDNPHDVLVTLRQYNSSEYLYFFTSLWNH